MIKQWIKISAFAFLFFNMGSISVRAEGDGNLEKIRQEVVKIMYITPDADPNAETGNISGYEDNLNSVRENQKKIQLQSASRGIALGKRAVALATQSGKDVDAVRENIEGSDDIVNMLKGIATLQAQTLQKTNEITSLRAKILELDSIDSIVRGDIVTTESLDENAQKGGKK